MVSREFLLAGNAIFTVSNPEGNHYTFKVVQAKHSLGNGPAPFFISVLTGQDNSNSYTYLGMVLENGVKLTAKSKFKKDTILYKVADWAVRGILNEGDLPAGYQIDHAGACGRCGRKLTTPDSIKLGLGPICANRI